MLCSHFYLLQIIFNFSTSALSDIRAASALASPLLLPCINFWLSGIVFDFFEEVWWDISGSQSGLQAFDIDHNPVLAGDTCNTSCYAFEGAVCDSHKSKPSIFTSWLPT